MKNKKSIYLIVAISIFVGTLHFLIGPDYNGIYKIFVRSYLIDILLPLNLYLLLQVALRKHMKTIAARIIGAVFTFSFGCTVEFLQYMNYDFLGSTFDPWDIFMYALGTALALLIDLTILNKFERKF